MRHDDLCICTDVRAISSKSFVNNNINDNDNAEAEAEADNVPASTLDTLVQNVSSLSVYWSHFLPIWYSREVKTHKHYHFDSNC